MQKNGLSVLDLLLCDPDFIFLYSHQCDVVESRLVTLFYWFLTSMVNSVYYMAHNDQATSVGHWKGVIFSIFRFQKSFLGTRAEKKIF